MSLRFCSSGQPLVQERLGHLILFGKALYDEIVPNQDESAKSILYHEINIIIRNTIVFSQYPNIILPYVAPPNIHFAGLSRCDRGLQASCNPEIHTRYQRTCIVPYLQNRLCKVDICASIKKQLHDLRMPKLYCHLYDSSAVEVDCYCLAPTFFEFPRREYYTLVVQIFQSTAQLSRVESGNVDIETSLSLEARNKTSAMSQS